MSEGSKATAVSRWGILAAFVVLAIVGAVYLSGLDTPFGNNDEVIYGQFIRAMHETGAYHELRYEGHLTHQRPTTTVTLYALVARIIPGELGIRLLPVCFTLLVCIFAGAAVWSFTNRLDASLLAALVIAGCPSLFVYGRLVSSDPPFLLACTGALWATMAAQREPKWFLWACVALGAAFATKSFAAGIPAVASAPWLLIALRRHWKHKELRLLLSVAGFLVVAAPYYLVGVILRGNQFIDEHIMFNLVQRASGDIVGLGRGGPAFYFEHLWTVDGAISTLLLLGGVVISGFVAFRARHAHIAAATTYSCLILALFSALDWRIGHYLLPFYSGAAICVGVSYAKLVDFDRFEKPLYRFLAPTLAPVLALALMFDSLTEPRTDPLLLPSTDTVVLAESAREVTAPDEKIYSLDFYAPALGYYSGRSWGLLTTSKQGGRIVDQVHIYKMAKTVSWGPPWPEGRLVVVIPEELMAHADQLELGPTKVLQRSGPLLLVERPSREP